MTTTLKLFTRRWGHSDVYGIDLTATGWDVHHLTYKGACNKRGEPTLYKSLDHDSVNYPAALGDYLEHLWDEMKAGNITDVQEALNELGEWISACEQASPSGVFGGFK